MANNEDRQYLAELEQKIKEARDRAFKAEISRIEQETEKRCAEYAKRRLAQEENQRLREFAQAEVERKHAENLLKTREEDILQRLLAERKNKEEARRLAEEERKRREEEERKLREEEEHRRREEERKRLEEEQRQREEEERRRQEEEKRQKDEQRRKQEEERKRRLQELILNAEQFLKEGDYESASVEIAKALVNEPENPDALSLQMRIKEKIEERDKITVVKEEKQRPKPITEKPPAPPRIEKKVSTKKPIPVLIAGLLGLVILTIALIFILSPKSIFSSDQKLVVKPWISINKSANEQILGSSLAEEVTNRLQMIPQLNVLGFSSSASVNRFQKSPDEIFASLNYLTTLTGTVDEKDNQVTFKIRLVAHPDDELWSKMYTIQREKLFSFPAEVVQDFINAMELKVDSSVLIAISYYNPVKPDAYIHYLQGLELIHYQTIDALQTAYNHFREAIDIDNEFAEGYAYAAQTLLDLFALEIPMKFDVAKQAEEYAKRAISLQPKLSSSRVAMARVKLLTNSYREAVTECETAISTSPHNSKAYWVLAQIYRETGNLDKALQSAQKAYQLSPRDPYILSTLASILQLLDRPSEALVHHEEVLTVIPDSFAYLRGPFADGVLITSALWTKYGERALAAGKIYFDENPNDYTALYRYARILQTMQKITSADSLLKLNKMLLQREIRSKPQDPMVMVYLALTQTALGEYSDAVTYANRAIELGKDNPTVLYKTAQVFALQNKKLEAIQMLRKAVSIKFEITEILNFDFYNVHKEKEFLGAIQRPMQ